MFNADLVLTRIPPYPAGKKYRVASGGKKLALCEVLTFLVMVICPLVEIHSGSGSAEASRFCCLSVLAAGLSGSL